MWGNTGSCLKNARKFVLIFLSGTCNHGVTRSTGQSFTENNLWEMTDCIKHVWLQTAFIFTCLLQHNKATVNQCKRLTLDTEVQTMKGSVKSKSVCCCQDMGVKASGIEWYTENIFWQNKSLFFDQNWKRIWASVFVTTCSLVTAGNFLMSQKIQGW